MYARLNSDGIGHLFSHGGLERIHLGRVNVEFDNVHDGACGRLGSLPVLTIKAAPATSAAIRMFRYFKFQLSYSSGTRHAGFEGVCGKPQVPQPLATGCRDRTRIDATVAMNSGRSKLPRLCVRTPAVWGAG